MGSLSNPTGHREWTPAILQGLTFESDVWEGPAPGSAKPFASSRPAPRPWKCFATCVCLSSRFAVLAKAFAKLEGGYRSTDGAWWAPFIQVHFGETWMDERGRFLPSAGADAQDV